VSDPAPGSPTVGVVIVNYQSWRLLEVCLGELLSHRDAPIKVVVVDNDSPDDRLTAFAKRFPSVRFIRNPGNPGFAQACNVGAGAVEGELLLFLNPDAVMSPAAILELGAALMAQSTFGIVSPALEDADGHRESTGSVFPGLITQLPLGRPLAELLARRRWADQSNAVFRACDYVPGCALMIRRSTFDALGGWSQTFWMYCEDIDLCWRLRKSGLNVGWADRWVARHIKGQSSGSSEDLAVRCRAEHVRARHLLYARHLRGLRLVATHVLEAAKRLARLVPAALMDWVRGGSAPRYRVRRRTLACVLAYYGNWLRGGGVAAPIGNWQRGD
jgi:hypothetical protein